MLALADVITNASRRVHLNSHDGREGRDRRIPVQECSSLSPHGLSRKANGGRERTSSWRSPPRDGFNDCSSYFTRARFSASTGSLVLVDLSWLVRYSAIKGVRRDRRLRARTWPSSPSRSSTRTGLDPGHAKKWVFWWTLSERNIRCRGSIRQPVRMDFGIRERRKVNELMKCRDGEGASIRTPVSMLSAVSAKADVRAIRHVLAQRLDCGRADAGVSMSDRKGQSNDLLTEMAGVRNGRRRHSSTRRGAGTRPSSPRHAHGRISPNFWRTMNEQAVLPPRLRVKTQERIDNDVTSETPEDLDIDDGGNLRLALRVIRLLVSWRLAGIAIHSGSFITRRWMGHSSPRRT